MVTVIGAGVSGLTTAVALRRAGVDAHIVASEPAESAVSWVAAAVWTMPDLEGRDPERRWALRTREVFAQLAGDPTRGVAELFQVELFRDDPGPTWWETTPFVTRLDPPRGYRAALGVEGFRIDPTLYLPWLRRWYESMGGTIERGQVQSFADIDGPVVNCTGLGSRELAGDDTLYPIRGQVVAVHAPSVTEGIADESDQQRIAYVYPRSREVILGGTRQIGVSDTSPDPEEVGRIVSDAIRLDPRLEDAEIIATRVGVRPGRPSVRVEAQPTSDQMVFHNYGHGGHGYLLSWGCAEQVVSLVVRAQA